MRVLGVAEKPAAAKEIARILGGGGLRTRGSASKFNPNYDFSQTLGRQSVAVTMTSVTGHLMDMSFEGRFASWDRSHPSEIFEAPILKSVKKDLKPLEENLKKEAKNADVLVLWLDCDREGENIAYEVLEVCKTSNPRLQVKRAKFSAFIPSEIVNAWNSLGVPDPNLSDAVEARMEIDLRIGSAFSRFQTKLLRPKYEGLPNVLSYGPCQFPTLGFVVERHLKIQAFIPEEFWNLVCTKKFKPDDQEGLLLFKVLTHEILECIVRFSWDRGRLFDRISCIALFELCLRSSCARVTNVKSSVVRKWKPFPLSTVEFQKLAAKKLKLSSQKAMSVSSPMSNPGSNLPRSLNLCTQKVSSVIHELKQTLSQMLQI
jgi:DNA topoisomerase-3